MKTYNKSEIFKAAWKRYKMLKNCEGQTFSKSLKIAWDRARSIEITIGEEVRDNQMRNFWVAQILGLDTQYGFARTFISEKEQSSKSSRHNYYNVTAELLESNVYEICEKGRRYFVTIKKGEQIQLSRSEVKYLVA